jgi:hypothetical protein
MSATALAKLEITRRPLPRTADDFMANDAEHAASANDWRVEQRRDPERRRVALRQLGCHRIVHRVFCGDHAAIPQGADVPRVIYSEQFLAGCVLAFRPVVLTHANQTLVTIAKQPEPHALDIQRLGAHLGRVRSRSTARLLPLQAVTRQSQARRFERHAAGFHGPRRIVTARLI